MLRHREQYRAEMDALRKSQEVWREQQRRETEEENQRIELYVRERDEKLAEEQKVSADRKRADMQLREQMCTQLEEIEVNVWH